MTFEVNVLATTAVVAFKLPTLALPVTANDVNVPTEVIFGCALVVTVPAVVAEPAEVANVAFATVPDTLAPATALAVVANDTAPVTLAPAIALKPLPLPVNTPVFAVILAAVILPFTLRPVSVPTEVMLGCAAVVTVPAVVAEPALVAAPLNAPTKVVAVIELLDKFALIPVLMTALEFPLALEVVNVG